MPAKVVGRRGRFFRRYHSKGRVLTLAGLLVAHGPRLVARITFLTIVTVAARCVVLAVDTDAATSLAGQLIEFRVEATLARVAITCAG